MIARLQNKYGHHHTFHVFYGTEEVAIDVTDIVFISFCHDGSLTISNRISFNHVFGDPIIGTPKWLMINDPPQFFIFPENRKETIHLTLHQIPLLLSSPNITCIDLHRSNVDADLTYVNRLKGLPVIADHSQPLRLNILLPGLNTSLTGGPLCIFQIAYLFSRHQIPIRMIFTQQSPVSAAQIIQLLPSYQLSQLNVEWLDYQQEIRCHPSDIFMGTLYTTAILAHVMQKKLNTKPILYFIQDFEPYFFEHSSDSAEAYYTYDLPHIPIFNSHLLEKYFQQLKIGVYANDFLISKPISMMYFPSYVSQFNFDCIQNKARRRLIVYARPHAQRNAYKFTINCLWQAVYEGLFTTDKWEIIGIGGYDKMPHIHHLGNRDVTLYNVSHMTFDDYVKLIQSGDVGLCLMMTPHPSLPPFDFVSCGMLVVTNTLHSRTADDYRLISHNFFPGKTNIGAIVEQLKLAVAKIDDLNFRQYGSNLRNLPPTTINYHLIRQLLSDQQVPCYENLKTKNRDSSKSRQSYSHNHSMTINSKTIRDQNIKMT